MSFEITTALKKQYHENFEILCQQKGSRLQALVRNEPLSGKEGFFDQIGATTARKRTTRHGDTPLVSTPHARRRVAGSMFDWADLIDQFDTKATVADPEGKYVVNASYAMGRAKDDEIIAAALATAYTGEEGQTPISFDTANNQIPHGSQPMTLDKLLIAKEILDGWEVDEDITRHVLYNSKASTALLKTTEIKSADYNTVKALVKGEIDEFLGFKFTRIERLLYDSGSQVRNCLAFAQDGLLLGANADIVTRISERADKNHATQVYAGMMVGATRMDEKKVVDIQCYEGT